MRLAVLLFALVSAHASAQTSPVPEASRQLVLVTSADWRATDATLRTFERDGAGEWREVLSATPTVVGRSGLGWGRGLHAPQDGPQKREGDGRAPAGAFALSASFGYAETEPTGLPYVQATNALKCVDDADSRFYNRVVDQRDVRQDWTSRERMRRADSLYSLGVVVAHNGPGVSTDLVPSLAAEDRAPVAGGGSCIFLHVWRGSGSSTAGCTAMPSAALRRVMAWLDADLRPVFVQLPQAERDRLAEAWGLPDDS